VYQERLEPRPGRVYASGVCADGKIYYVSRENGAYVLAAQPRFELLAHNQIASDTSVFNATPAISQGKILLRSDSFLYCIDEK
jgi:outer membrane protein assembly factor BamB